MCMIYVFTIVPNINSVRPTSDIRVGHISKPVQLLTPQKPGRLVVVHIQERSGYSHCCSANNLSDAPYSHSGSPLFTQMLPLIHTATLCTVLLIRFFAEQQTTNHST